MIRVGRWQYPNEAHGRILEERLGTCETTQVVVHAYRNLGQALELCYEIRYGEPGLSQEIQFRRVTIL